MCIPISAFVSYIWYNNVKNDSNMWHYLFLVVYVSGLVCFQSPTEEVDKCANKLVVDITELTMKQIQQSLPRNLFFREYCK